MLHGFNLSGREFKFAFKIIQLLIEIDHRDCARPCSRNGSIVSMIIGDMNFFGKTTRLNQNSEFGARILRLPENTHKTKHQHHIQTDDNNFAKMMTERIQRMAKSIRL